MGVGAGPIRASSRVSSLSAHCGDIVAWSASAPDRSTNSASSSKDRGSSRLHAASSKRALPNPGLIVLAAAVSRASITSSALVHRVAPCRIRSVGALGARVERRAGHGEDLAALLVGEPRRDERPRPACRLDHDRRHAEARDDAVAPGEIAAARLPGEGHLRYDRALIGEWPRPAGRAPAGKPGRARLRAPRRCRWRGPRHELGRRYRAPSPDTTT